MTVTEPLDLDDEERPVTRGEGVAKLDRAVRLAHAQMLDPQEARYLVGMYYQLQGERITMANQVRALKSADKPTDLHEYFAQQFVVLEGQARLALKDFAEASPTGQWALAQVGIGPVITAGLLAHIDPTRAPTVSSVWRFAGLDPSMVWGKGEKRPYNADLKVLCWKIGDSFVKQKGRPGCFYGHLYEKRKEVEVSRNAAGDFANQAAATLEAKNITDPKTLAAYRDGKLPDGRIDYRARRVAIKLFLSHFWQTYREERGLDTPLPYAFDIMGHGHYIDRPGPVPSFT